MIVHRLPALSFNPEHIKLNSYSSLHDINRAYIIALKRTELWSEVKMLHVTNSYNDLNQNIYRVFIVKYKYI